jgi:xanthine dehydrogenase small subunit
VRGEIRFIRHGKVRTLRDFDPALTLLDYLRTIEGSVGTKEGCNEGDCGACTVVLARMRDGVLIHEPVNSCILLAGQLDGAELITVEELEGATGLHPVQEAMVRHHGSQCGFCTPGIVMSLFALYQDGARPVPRSVVVDQLSGNLCRCTGYRPIIAAGLSACDAAPSDHFRQRHEARSVALAALASDDDVFVAASGGFFAAPASLEALCRLYDAHPDATPVSGSTDVGLWVTKQLRELPKIIWLGRVREMDEIIEADQSISIGATVTHQRAHAVLAALDPDLGELLRRFGSPQVRASGTVGGNIANGSPIGDLAPALIAFGASVVLESVRGVRVLPLENFFIAYGQQDRKPGEFVRELRVPRLHAGEHFRCYKVSKRRDDDISAVMGAFRLGLEARVIASVRAAYGGMAAIPRRAVALEKALLGLDLDRRDGWPMAIQAVESDFTPIGDARASAAYRMETAKALVERMLMEVASGSTIATRLAGSRELQHGA